MLTPGAVKIQQRGDARTESIKEGLITSYKMFTHDRYIKML